MALSAIWLRLTGRDRWLPATATVFSYEWQESRSRYSEAHHHIAYYYTANGERYSGEFDDYGNEDEPHLRPGDTFGIRYNPAKPSMSYYPEQRTRAAVVVGVALGMTAVLIFLLRDYLRHR
jgi:hypothetical protein